MSKHAKGLGLLLERRRLESVFVRHAGATLEIKVMDYTANSARLRLSCVGVAVTVDCYHQQPMRIEHEGETLEVRPLDSGGKGPRAILAFKGPQSFDIERDDVNSTRGSTRRAIHRLSTNRPHAQKRSARPK